MDNELIKIQKRNGGALVRETLFNWRNRGKTTVGEVGTLTEVQTEYTTMSVWNITPGVTTNLQ